MFKYRLFFTRALKSDSADHVFFFTSSGVQNTNLAPCPKKIKLVTQSYSLPSVIALKGQCHQIFRLQFFSGVSFPHPPKNNKRVISNFFENSRRYSRDTVPLITVHVGGQT
jgi:hypothetical protein